MDLNKTSNVKEEEMLFIILVESCLILIKLYVYPNITWLHACLPLLFYLAWKISGALISLFVICVVFIYTIITKKIFKK